jgi:hypothetical protein
MRTLRLACRATAFGLALALACSSLSVRSDWDPEADFSALRSWAWLEPSGEDPGHPLLRSPLLHDRVRRAVEAELAARGYEQAPAERADFRVGYHLSLEQKLDTYTIDHTYGYGRWGVWTYPETYVQEYQEGTLILDVVDARRGKLAWRGWASRPVYEQPSPEESERNVRKAVSAVLDRFPPKPGQRR